MSLNSTFIAPSFGENGWKPRFPELIGEGAQGAWCAGRFTIYRSRFYYSLVPSWTGNMWNALCFFSIYHVESKLPIYLQHFGSWNLPFSVFVKLLLWKHPSLTGEISVWLPILSKHLTWVQRTIPGTDAKLTERRLGQTLLSRAGQLISSICLDYYKSWEVLQDCRN